MCVFKYLGYRVHDLETEDLDFTGISRVFLASFLWDLLYRREHWMIARSAVCRIQDNWRDVCLTLALTI